MCLRSVEVVGDAAELGKGILDKNLLDNPPDGRSVGDVVVHASRHSRVQDAECIAIAREDEGARVAMFRKGARSLAIVVDDHLPGLKSVIGADISVHTGVAAQSKLGRVAVLADDVEGIAILVLCVGIDEEATSKSATDGELEVGWDRPALTNGSNRPEEILELTGGVLVS